MQYCACVESNVIVLIKIEFLKSQTLNWQINYEEEIVVLRFN